MKRKKKEEESEDLLDDEDHRGCDLSDRSDKEGELKMKSQISGDIKNYMKMQRKASIKAGRDLTEVEMCTPDLLPREAMYHEHSENKSQAEISGIS